MQAQKISARRKMGFGGRQINDVWDKGLPNARVYEAENSGTQQKTDGLAERILCLR